MLLDTRPTRRRRCRPPRWASARCPACGCSSARPLASSPGSLRAGQPRHLLPDAAHPLEAAHMSAEPGQAPNDAAARVRADLGLMSSNSQPGEVDAAFAPDVSGTSISVTRSRCAAVSTRAGFLLWSYP